MSIQNLPVCNASLDNKISDMLFLLVIIIDYNKILGNDKVQINLIDRSHGADGRI